MVLRIDFYSPRGIHQLIEWGLSLLQTSEDRKKATLQVGMDSFAYGRYAKSIRQSLEGYPSDIVSAAGKVVLLCDELATTLVSFRGDDRTELHFSVTERAVQTIRDVMHHHQTKVRAPHLHRLLVDLLTDMLGTLRTLIMAGANCPTDARKNIYVFYTPPWYRQA